MADLCRCGKAPKLSGKPGCQSCWSAYLDGVQPGVFVPTFDGCRRDGLPGGKNTPALQRGLKLEPHREPPRRLAVRIAGLEPAQTKAERPAQPKTERPPQRAKPKSYARTVAETWLTGGATPEALAAARARLPAGVREIAACAEAELIEELGGPPPVERLASRIATRYRDRKPDAKSPKRGARLQLDEGRAAAPEPEQDEPERDEPDAPVLTDEQKRERRDALEALDQRALFWRERLTDELHTIRAYNGAVPWARWARPLLELAAQYRALDGVQPPEAEETAEHAERIACAMRKADKLRKRGPKEEWPPLHPDWPALCAAEASVTRLFKLCRMPSLKRARDTQRSREVRERIEIAPALFADETGAERGAA